MNINLNVDTVKLDFEKGDVLITASKSYFIVGGDFDGGDYRAFCFNSSTCTDFYCEKESLLNHIEHATNSRVVRVVKSTNLKLSEVE